MYKPVAIANYFIDRAEKDGRLLTPMQLQKLVYFAHGWHLAIASTPLIDEQVEAWKYGPVIRSLYRAFRDSGSAPVSAKYRPLDVECTGEGNGLLDFQLKYLPPPSIDDQPEEAEQTKALLEKIWDIYGKYSGIQLSNMTHLPGTPWKQTVDKYGGAIPRYTDIPQGDIRDYFVALGNRNA